MSNLNTVSTLQDLLDHVNGLSNKHNADAISLTTPLVIDGSSAANVEDALIKLNEALDVFVPDATGSVKGILKLSGDLGGTANAPSVNKIRGMEVSSGSPDEGDVLTWTGYSWSAEPPSYAVPNASTSVYGKVRLSDGVTTSGDIGGNAGNLTVIKLQDYPVSIGDSGNTVYEDHYLKWDGSNWINSYLTKADENNFGTVRLAGDVAKHSSSGQLRVTGIQTYPVHCPCEPYDGDVLTWIGEDGYWIPKSMATSTSSSFGGIKLTSDLGGTANSPKVVGWKYNELGPEFDTPQRYDIPIYNSSIAFGSGSPTFGFDLGPGDDRWSLINLQDIIANVEFTASGDLSGGNVEQTVVGLRGVEIDESAVEPTAGDVLMYQQVIIPSFDLGSGTVGKWVPTQLSPSDFFDPAGDLSGGNFSQSVVGWRGRSLSTSFSSPSVGDVPIYNGTFGGWGLTNFSSILAAINGLNTYEPGNPEIKQYTQNSVRNKYYKYQNSVQSVNTVRGEFLEYNVLEGETVFIKGKIIGRVIQNNEPEIIIPMSLVSSSEDGYVDLTPAPPDRSIFKFDLDSPVEPGYTVVYDIEASFVKQSGVIHAMVIQGQNPYSAIFDGGSNHNIVACLSEYPEGIASTFYKPIIQLVDNSTIQIASGYTTNSTINWTMDVEIRENGF